MLQQKVCMLGSFGVGKTSLVSRFVYSLFTEKYLSTIGVKIDRKVVQVDGDEAELLLWDLHGDDEFQRVRASYLRGMAGYFLVADGTRAETLQVAEDLQQLAHETVGDIPFLLLINKADLTDDWEIDLDRVAELEAQGWQIRKTSAKSGRLVTASFEYLTRQMLEEHAKLEEEDE